MMMMTLGYSNNCVKRKLNINYSQIADIFLITMDENMYIWNQSQ